jgi:antitoxin ParD1/3/4
MAREATLSVSLTHQLKSYVAGKVDSGQFESASEVIRQGLRAMQLQEQQDQQYWSMVRRKVAQARRQVETGDTLDGPTEMARIIDGLSDQKKKSKRAAKNRANKTRR